jgi:membrane protein
MAKVAMSSAHRHGQLANSPMDIPPLGWRDVARRVFARIAADRVMLIAAGVTYYMLMALVPALAVFVSLYGLVSNPGTVGDQISLLAGILPQGGLDILSDQLSRLTTTGTPTLSLTLIVSLVVSLWSAAAGVRSLFDAMNIAYGESEKRNFFMLNLMALGSTLAVVAAAVVFLVVVVLIPVAMHLLDLPAGFEWLVRVASYGLMAIAVLVGVGVLYRWGPSRKQAKWRWLTPGVVVAVIGVGLVSVLFSWYAANFSNYNAAYGSLGALVGLLTWIWLSVTIIILGAELNAELEHQTAEDSTIGHPKPMGTRGAYMADNVAVVGRHPAVAEPASPARRRDRAILLGITGLVLLASAQRSGAARRRRGR